MSWQKHFTRVPDAKKIEQWLDSQSSGTNHSGYASNFQSWLPEVYTGPPNRIERYKEYEQMDKGNTEISQSLDTISEFCTQKEEKSMEFFEFQFNDDASEAEIQTLKETLRSWTKLNLLDKRLWRMFRNTLVYGDQFFVRDPETYKWLWIDPFNVEKIIVNEAEGKKPEEYHVMNPDLNLQTLNISPTTRPNSNHGFPSGMSYTSQGVGPSVVNTKGMGHSQNGTSSLSIDATHIIHFSLSEGLDTNWPFGNSILENIYKAYKQVALLEDAILIYRVHRAPERRVFYIDVGNMPPNRVMAYLERTKNEINQRRIPTRSGGGSNLMDATYNPMSINEDYFFPQHADGRGSRVDTLPGGENLGQINDLNYFLDQLKKGLRVPRSYISSGSNDDSAMYGDGRATTALIAELRFSEYCKRLQNLVNQIFDREFKLYLKFKGITVDSGLFNLTLNIPQNFAKYRQIELDNAMISTWGSVANVPYISKRFALERWLGLSEDEIVRNETMWKEENPGDDTGMVGDDMGMAGGIDDLRSLNIRPDMGAEDFGEFDQETPQELGPDVEPGIGGDAMTPDAGGGTVPPAPALGQ